MNRGKARLKTTREKLVYRDEIDRKCKWYRGAVFIKCYHLEVFEGS